MTKIDPTRIHMFYIRLFKSCIQTTDKYLEKPIKPVKIKVGFAQESGLNLEERSVRILLHINLAGCSVRGRELGITAEFGIEYQLRVENLEEFIEKESEVVRIDGMLGATLLGLSFSTARGIIFEHTLSSYFGGVILPVIDPKDILSSKKG